MSITINNPILPLIRTPVEFVPKRQTGRHQISEGEEISIFEAEGPGCVNHFWLCNNTKGWGLRLRIYTDGTATPQVDMELNHFFGIMLDKSPYRVESPGVKVLPLNAYNCYLPIPFSKSCTIRIFVSALSGRIDARESVFLAERPEKATVYFQANWQQYDRSQELTPHRLHAYFHEERPAQKKGIFYAADLEGEGFVACMFKALAKKEQGDQIYHTGGSTWLIDGETGPNAYRGINEEDDFNFSYGYFPYQSEWSGCAYGYPTKRATDEAVTWRFFGPDPVPFNTSMIIHFGSRADDTQTMIHYYKIPGSSAPEILTPRKWEIIGPFDASSYDTFRQDNPAETSAEWKEIADGKAILTLESRHGWIDPRPQYRGFKDLCRPYAQALLEKEPNLLGGVSLGCAFYGRGEVHIEDTGMYYLRLGFDDWLTLWVNGELINTFRHERGFEIVRVPLMLEEGINTVLIKLSNRDNREFRLWALNCVFERMA